MTRRRGRDRSELEKSLMTLTKISRSGQDDEHASNRMKRGSKTLLRRCKRVRVILGD